MFGNFDRFNQPTYIAAIYTRVSSTKQAIEGHGLDAQLTKCQDLINYKRWKQYPEVYSDEGLSGSLDFNDRPQLKKLLDDASQKKFDCVVFYSLDRLGRSTKIILHVIEMLSNLSLKIVSCQEHIDTTTASGELMLTFFAGMAQYEKRNIIERMDNGKKELRKKTGEYGGPVPLGYRRGMNGVIEIEPEEADIVTMIFRGRNQGLSMNKIANYLNQFGIKTKNGKKWYSASVKVILDNQEKYEGSLRNNNTNGIRWPKIINYNND